MAAAAAEYLNVNKSKKVVSLVAKIEYVCHHKFKLDARNNG